MNNKVVIWQICKGSFYVFFCCIFVIQTKEILFCCRCIIQFLREFLYKFIFCFGCRVLREILYKFIFCCFVVELYSMLMRLVSVGGIYNVRVSEMFFYLQDRQLKMVICIVYFLDDSQQDFEVDVSIIQFFIYFKVFYIYSFGISILLTLLKVKGF